MSRVTGAEPGGALSLRTWFLEAEAAASIARQVCPTPFVPDSLKRWVPGKEPTKEQPGVLDLDGTIAVVTAALLAGQELGFSPMASLRSIDIIKGTPALRALALRALVQSHGHDIVVIESTPIRARVRGCRLGGEVQEAMWTIDRAKQFGLYPGPEYGQWRRQPQAQLVARATAECARWIAADSILGLPYIAEELRDGYDPEEQPPGGAESDQDGTGATASTTKPGKKRATLRALPAPSVPMAPPADPPPEVPRITRTQVRELTSVLRALGITTRPEAAAAVRRYLDHDITSADDLTYDEAAKVIVALRREEAAADTEGSQGDPADE